jgi:hypothetical protein
VERKVSSSALACAVSSRVILLASFDGFVVVDRHSLVELFVASKVFAHKETVTSCCASETSVCLGTSSGSLLVCNVATRSMIWEKNAHSDAVTSVLFEGSTVFSGCRDGRLGTWLIRDDKFVLLSFEKPLDCDSCESFVDSSIVRVHSHHGASFCRFADNVLVARIPQVMIVQVAFPLLDLCLCCVVAAEVFMQRSGGRKRACGGVLLAGKTGRVSVSFRCGCSTRQDAAERLACSVGQHSHLLQRRRRLRGDHG